MNLPKEELQGYHLVVVHKIVFILLLSSPVPLQRASKAFTCIILFICCDPEDRGIGPACYKVLVKSGGSQEEIRAI